MRDMLLIMTTQEVFVALTTLSMLLVAEVSSLTHEQRLLDIIRASTDPQSRPVINSTDSVVVKMGLALNQIIDLEEKIQILKIMSWVRLYWTSENIKWDPGEYGGLKSIRLPPEQIWTPDIALYNFASDAEPRHMLFNVIVYADGSTSWNYPALLTTTCTVNIQHFPYDQQKCNLTFGSWTFHGDDLNLTNRSGSGDTSIFVSNGEWEVLSMPVVRQVKKYECCDEPYPTLIYTINMQRRALFYAFNLLLPGAVITGITVVGFCLPPASGEKVSLSITILLSLTVFLLLVAESMPPNSESIPLIGWFFAICIVFVAMSSVITVVILGAYYHGTHDREVPEWLKRLIYCLSVLVRKKELVQRHGFRISYTVSNGDKHSIKKISNGEVSSNTDITNIRLTGANFSSIDNEVHPLRIHLPTNNCTSKNCHSLFKLSQSTETLLRIKQSKQKSERIQEQWHLVALVLDRFFFLVFSVVTVCMISVVFGYSPEYD